MATHGLTRRDLFRLGALTGVVAVGGPALLTACSEVPQKGEGGGTLQRAKDAKTIKVGIAGEIPYGYTDNGKVTGEAPEVAKAVFKNLGIDTVDAKQVEFGQLIQALNAGQFDMVAAGMAVKPDRCKNAQFSIVDYVTPTALLVPKGNPKGINNFDDLKAKGETIAVVSGTIEQATVTALGIAKDKIQTYDGPPELLQALTTKRAYCGALTDITLRRLLQDNPDAPLEVTEGFVPVIDGKDQVQAGGFVFRKDDKDLVDAFNKELKKLQDSGEWLKITEPFGFTKANEVPDDVTTEKLCQG
jgi:polar amino acid transport system substrate-binding protein